MRLTDQEVEQYRTQLSNILQHFQSLQQVDTTGVEPTGHATDVNTVLREDRADAPLDREQVLANAPAVSGEFIRIRPVLD
jgi:aspartyl-tRNA(Asn)/glutamyl-tRNA(Gln) amidotransferase subunit C